MIVLAQSPQSPAPVRLYKDSEMQAVRKKFKAKREDGLLNIVKNGRTKPLTVIFKTLEIDRNRLGPPVLTQMDFVMYHDWQVSPNYELSIMVAVNGNKDDGYGVRLRKRRK